MKASAVIEELQKLVEEFGDLDVFAPIGTNSKSIQMCDKVTLVFYEHECGSDDCRCQPHFMVDAS